MCRRSGWWCEGYNGNNGWAIGDESEYASPEEEDNAHAQSLYDTLENEIVPLYYNERSADRLPGDWIALMKESIRTLAPKFNITRMIKEYTEELYFPAVEEKAPPSMEILDL